MRKRRDEILNSLKFWWNRDKMQSQLANQPLPLYPYSGSPVPSIIDIALNFDVRRSYENITIIDPKSVFDPYYSQVIDLELRRLYNQIKNCLKNWITRKGDVVNEMIEMNIIMNWKLRRHLKTRKDQIKKILVIQEESESKSKPFPKSLFASDAKHAFNNEKLGMKRKKKDKSKKQRRQRTRPQESGSHQETSSSKVIKIYINRLFLNPIMIYSNDRPMNIDPNQENNDLKEQTIQNLLKEQIPRAGDIINNLMNIDSHQNNKTRLRIDGGNIKVKKLYNQCKFYMNEQQIQNIEQIDPTQEQQTQHPFEESISPEEESMFEFSKNQRLIYFDEYIDEVIDSERGLPDYMLSRPPDRQF
jgi:hypothetical protein